MGAVGLFASRGFAIFLLALSIAVLFVWSRVPEFYSPWLLLIPLALIVSLILCMIRRIGAATNRDITLWGSMLFHLGMVVIIAAAVVGPLSRFHAIVVLPQGMDVDTADRELVNTMAAPFAEIPQIVYLRLEHHHTEYSKGRFPIEYVAELVVGYMEDGVLRTEHVTLRVNEPAKIAGSQLLLVRGYMVPRFVLTDSHGNVLFNSLVRLSNVTAQQDSFQIDGAGLVLYTRFFPDVYRKGRTYRTLSAIPRDPAFGIKVAKKSKPFEDIWKGVLRVGEYGEFDGLRLEFAELKPVVEVEITEDPSYPLVFGGWIMVVFGLLIRYIPKLRSDSG